MPQAFYILPVPASGFPDQGLPIVPPGYPDQGLPGGGHPWLPGHLPPPVDPGWGGGWAGGGHPAHPLPRPPVYPSTGPVFPPIYPVDPDWGVGEGGGVRHPLLWLLPWLIKPAAPQAAVSAPPEGPKPDPDKAYLKILVAVAPGKFKWAWLEQEVGVVTPA